MAKDRTQRHQQFADSPFFETTENNWKSPLSRLKSRVEEKWDETKEYLQGIEHKERAEESPMPGVVRIEVYKRGKVIGYEDVDVRTLAGKERLRGGEPGITIPIHHAMTDPVSDFMFPEQVKKFLIKGDKDITG